MPRPIETIDLVCAGCGQTFTIPAYEYRQRIERTTGGRLYCSRACRFIKAATDGDE